MQRMPTIYLDVLLAINWFIDYLLLSAVSRILRVTTKQWRIIASAFIGAVIACVLFLVSLSGWLVFATHSIGAAVLVWIAFSDDGWYLLVRRTVVLYAVSVLFSGAVTLLWRITGSDAFVMYNGVIYVDISPLTLAILAVVSYGGICVYEFFTRSRVINDCDFRLQIDDGRGVCECRALYDSGMHLTEPFSGKAVVIVEWTVLAPYISEELREALCASLVGGNSLYGHRVRMVPYRTIGSDGLLASFIPKRLIVFGTRGEKRDVSGTYVAVMQGLNRGDYQALIGNDTVLKG